MNAKTGQARLFFALLPDASTVSAINFHAAQLAPASGRKVKQENYHITLHFLGNVSTQNIDALILDCGNIHTRPFTLTISEAGWWKKPQIFWLAPQGTPESMSGLVGMLAKMSYKAKSAKRNLDTKVGTYFPHITLMRKVHEVPSPPVIKPFDWHATQFSLIQSVTHPHGVRYVELARWPLGPKNSAP